MTTGRKKAATGKCGPEFHVPRRLNLSGREQVLLRVVPQLNGCWHWIGHHHRTGYATYRGRQGHRVLYELFCGPVPDGLVLDHLCRDHGCVNQLHLEPVSDKENIRRGLKGILKTHCPSGHALAPPNLYVDPKGFRHCRACRRAQGVRFRHREIKETAA